jgi:hypothetical protein
LRLELRGLVQQLRAVAPRPAVPEAARPASPPPRAQPALMHASGIAHPAAMQAAPAVRPTPAAQPPQTHPASRAGERPAPAAQSQARPASRANERPEARPAARSTPEERPERRAEQPEQKPREEPAQPERRAERREQPQAEEKPAAQPERRAERREQPQAEEKPATESRAEARPAPVKTAEARPAATSAPRDVAERQITPRRAFEPEREPPAELALLKAEPHHQHVYEPLEETARHTPRVEPGLEQKPRIAPPPVLIAKTELKPATKTAPALTARTAFLQRLMRFGPSPLPTDDEEA